MNEEPTSARPMGRKNGAANWSAGVSGGAVLCVEAVAAIFAAGGCLDGAAIAEAIGVDRTAATNCMAHLRGSGIVEGIAGRKGGYVLSADPETLTALDVIRAVDAARPGSIFSDDVAPAFSELLRGELGRMTIGRIALEVKGLQCRSDISGIST